MEGWNFLKMSCAAFNKCDFVMRWGVFRFVPIAKYRLVEKWQTIECKNLSVKRLSFGSLMSAENEVDVGHIKHSVFNKSIVLNLHSSGQILTLAEYRCASLCIIFYDVN